MEYKIESEDIKEAFSLVMKGEKVQAIKLVREKSKAGLRESKEFVEYLDQEYDPRGEEDSFFYNIEIRGDVWNKCNPYTISDLLDAWNKASEIHMNLKKRGLM